MPSPHLVRPHSRVGRFILAVAASLFAALLLVWAISIAAWQSALLNGVWAAVGLVGVVRILRRRSDAPEPHVGD